MRLGVFGGSFNPVHYGHLLLAELCREQCSLDEVWFVPAARPPHKQGEPLANGLERVAMLELAIGGHVPFVVSHLEIERDGLSYSVDTLRDIARLRSDAELFFLMGADSLADWQHWRAPDEICRLATPVVVRRVGSPPPSLDAFRPFADADQLRRIAENQVQAPLIELSSSDIRQRVGAGLSIRFQTPRAVEKFIQTNGLFQSGSR